MALTRLILSAVLDVSDSEKVSSHTFLFQLLHFLYYFVKDTSHHALLGVNILLSQFVSSLDWEHKIYVSIASGINNTICWTSGQHIPCYTINLALKGLQYNSTVIYITPGIYIVEYGHKTQLRDKSQVAIIGYLTDSPGEQQKVIIKCTSLTGLSFLWCDNIILQSLTLYGYGGVHVSTSRNLSSQSFEFLMFQMACRVYIILSKYTCS